MVRVAHELGRRRLQQFLLDRQRRLPRRQPGTVADAEDVGVDGDGRRAEGDVAHHVGGLAPDAGQRLQRRLVVRDDTAVALDQEMAQGDDVLGLGVEEPDGLDVVLQFRLAERHHLLRCIDQLEQLLRRPVDADVGGLRRQRHRHQQRIGVGVVEFAHGLRLGVAEP